MIPHTLQKVLVPFYDGYTEEHDQKALKSLNVIKETPQTCKVDRGK